jgi:hypothetical protein
MAQGAGSWDPGMRAGDSDRERVVEQLREHHAAGRLTMDEFEERMRQAYDAKTFGELAPLTRDLPIDLARIAPSADAASRYNVRPQFGLGDFGHHHPMGRMRGPAGLARRRVVSSSLASWASVSILLTGIWLISALTGGGDWGNFWPAWPIGVWGLVLLSSRVGGRGRR